MVSHGLVLDLVERVGGVARHGTVAVPMGLGDPDELGATVAAWARRARLTAPTARSCTPPQARGPADAASCALDGYG